MDLHISLMGQPLKGYRNQPPIIQYIPPSEVLYLMYYIEKIWIIILNS